MKEPISQLGLKEIAKLKTLRALGLRQRKYFVFTGDGKRESWEGHSNITDSWLEDLAKLEALESLDLEGANTITNNCIKSLCLFSNLRCLGLAGTPITSAGFRELSQLRHLREVSIDGSDPNSLLALSNVKKLSVIKLKGLFVKDSAMLQLLKFESLSRVELHWTRIDNQVVSRFVGDCPKCKVDVFP